MLTLKNNIITICKYKLIKDDRVRYSTEPIDGYEVEELDVSSELWLDGKYCETIQQAREWLELGDIPETETDRLKRELVETQLALTEIYEMMVGGTNG